MDNAGFLMRPAFHLAFIAVVGLLIYSNTFKAPFQFDERLYITGNPIVKDLNYFVKPSIANKIETYGGLKNRYIGYLTFALNYKVHGLDVRGYHAVNLLIHILNAFLVYFLLRLTLKTPGLSSFPEIASASPRNDSFIPLFTALLFVSHPVQTEAVTYIFQRFASLAAFFSLLSLVLYIKWRQTPSPNLKFQISNLKFYLMSLISALLAMKTKENAFTLPLVITLYEFMFFRGNTPLKSPLNKGGLRGVFLPLVPFLLTMLIIPLSFLGTDKPVGELLSDTNLMEMPSQAQMPRLSYLFTQFRVIITYIRLILLPINQNLDYDYPVSDSFFNAGVFLSFLSLLLIFCLAVYLLLRSRTAGRQLRLIAFGIFWFFIALSVESSIIPLYLLINEYRVYLPFAGASIAITAGIMMFIEERLHDRKIRMLITSVCISALLIFSFAAYKRNAVWKSEEGLWEDVVRKSPKKARGHNNLAGIYGAKGLIDEAIKHYEIAAALDPYSASVHYNLAVAYTNKGLIDRAVEHFKTALTLKPSDADSWFALGVIHFYKGDKAMAQKEFEEVLKLRPDYSRAKEFLASTPDN